MGPSQYGPCGNSRRYFVAHSWVYLIYKIEGVGNISVFLLDKNLYRTPGHENATDSLGRSYQNRAFCFCNYETVFKE